MEMTPKKILEFTEYVRKNPDATKQNYYADELGSILHLLCDGNPKHAPSWSCHLIEKLDRNRHTQYSLSTFMGFIVNGKKPRMSDRRNVRLRDSKNYQQG